MRIALAVIACAALVAFPATAQDTNTGNMAAPPPAAETTDNLAQPVQPQAVPVTTAEPAAPAPAPRRRAPDKGFPWGVIGLVGLIGLLGRKRS